MRRVLILTLSLAVATGVAVPMLLAGGPQAHAQGDPKRDARLLYLEGKFQEADALLTQAGPDVENDLDLRAQLADAAEKSLKNKAGEERRSGLEAIKRNWAVIAKAAPENGAAVVSAILAAKAIAELDLASKRTGAAAAQATWALELGEKAAAAGLSPATKAALGEAYGLRASTSRKAEDADKISADFRKGAALLEEAANGSEKESDWLGAAAELRFKEATFIHDTIPLETEKRDDEALTAAAALGRRACEAKDAADTTFVLHIRTLCAAREWKTPGDFGAPFMEPLVPAYDGLKLLVPKGGDWKKQESTSEWDLILDRKYDANDSSVQIMVTAQPVKSSIGAVTWHNVEEGVKTLWDRRKSGYQDLASENAPALLDDKKKGPNLWHFSVAGTINGSSRRNKMAEWVWPSTTKKDVVWDLRIIDWRNTTSIEDPDIVAFVQSAIPPGLWPPGAAKPEDPKGKKTPPKKKK